MRAAFLLFLSCGSLFGWGCEGHQIVALIARAHLTPEAARAVTNLLESQPAPAKSFCAGRLQDTSGMQDPMAAASTWADDVRREEHTGKWHYIDIPRGENDAASLYRYCPPIGGVEAQKDRAGCVVDGLEFYLAVLRDPRVSDAQKATALRYVIHFTGDLHQPLHTTDNNDNGGNCTSLQYFDAGHPENLHAVWDYSILERDLERRRETIAQRAARLDQGFHGQWAQWGGAPVNVEGWVWESHGLAEQYVYGKLSPQIPVQKPGAADCKAEAQKVASLHIQLGDAYQSAAVPVIDEQLAKAGYRLAAALNAIWP